VHTSLTSAVCNFLHSGQVTKKPLRIIADPLFPTGRLGTAQSDRRRTSPYHHVPPWQACRRCHTWGHTQGTHLRGRCSCRHLPGSTIAGVNNVLVMHVIPFCFVISHYWASLMFSAFRTCRVFCGPQPCGHSVNSPLWVRNT
jgi:hypothetical protein